MAQQDQVAEMWGGLLAGSLLRAGFLVLQHKSRPEGGCRLIARPTFQPLDLAAPPALRAFTRYLQEAGAAKEWTGVEQQEGCRVLDEITVVRDDTASTRPLEGTYGEFAPGPTGVSPCRPHWNQSKKAI